jgi:hypothetical protein
MIFSPSRKADPNTASVPETVGKLPRVGDFGLHIRFVPKNGDSVFPQSRFEETTFRASDRRRPASADLPGRVELRGEPDAHLLVGSGAIFEQFAEAVGHCHRYGQSVSDRRGKSDPQQTKCLKSLRFPLPPPLCIPYSSGHLTPPTTKKR